MKTIYRAFDGTEFDSREDCRNHEIKTSKIALIEAATESLKSFDIVQVESLDFDEQWECNQITALLKKVVAIDETTDQDEAQ